jgi:hypothetical protein
MNCTWVECDAIAKHPQFSKTGERWANLCNHHNAVFVAIIEDGLPGPILGAWVKAQGGAKKTSIRM